MSRRLVALALGVALGLAGCRLHLSYVDWNRAVTPTEYQEIDLGKDDRGSVLERLGPPDGVFYTPTKLVFDYEAERHRGTDFRFFLPTYFMTSAPFFLLRVPRIFFAPLGEPEEFEETHAERAGRLVMQGGLGLVPFTQGEDLLIVRGRQLRRDLLRVVMDRDTLATEAKALRLATGEYRHESLPDRVLLQTP